MPQSYIITFQWYQEEERANPTDSIHAYANESIMKTRLFKYIENVTSKNLNFSDKKIFLLKT